MIILISYVGYGKGIWCITVRIVNSISDLDLNPMTVVLKLGLDMVEMYHHTKNEVSMLRHSQVIA